MEPDDPRNDGRGAPAAEHSDERMTVRGFFSLAAAAARAQRDPATDWDGFVEALWHQVDAGFGLTEDVAEYPEVPRAWFDHRDDPPAMAWDVDETQQSQR
jgi:hypothetical protein